MSASLQSTEMAEQCPTGELPRGCWLVVAATSVAYVFFALYAAAVQHGLYADGSHLLLSMITKEGFVLFHPPRHVSHFLNQAPTVVALWLGVKNLYTLTFIYGLTLHLLPLAFTLACYAILPQDRKIFFVFPFLHFVAGTLSSALAVISEVPVASAIFWLLLCAILFGARSPRGWLILALAALGAVALHEVYSFLGLALAMAAAYRASQEKSSAVRLVFLALALSFVTISGMQIGQIVHPADETNRNTLLSGLRALTWLRIGRVPNLPALLGLVMLGLGFWSWIWFRVKGRPLPSSVLRALGAFVGLTAVIGIALPLYSDHYMVPYSQFVARYQSFFVSIGLCGIVALSLRGQQPTAQWRQWFPAGVVGCAVAGSLGWLLVAATYWARVVDDTKLVLATRAGLIPWQEAVSIVPEQNRRMFDRFYFRWTPPSMSMLLAASGQVSSLIDVAPGVEWQPFDPAIPDSLPRTRLLNTRPYIEALESGAAGVPLK